MKLLIVDDDPIIVDLILAYLGGEEGLALLSATNAEDAIRVVEEAGGVDLLITDVVMAPVDGFSLRETLIQALPDMQTIFVTAYDLAEHVERVAGNKILSKPVKREELLAEIKSAADRADALVQLRVKLDSSAEQTAGEATVATEAAANANLSHLMQKQGFTGRLDQFQLVDIIQMCCISRRTGRLRVWKGIDKGVLFLNEGRIVHAACGGETGQTAVYKIIGWDFGEFSLDENISAPQETITAGWEHIVMEGVRLRDEATGSPSAGPSDTGLIGKMLNDYRVDRKLGEGEWGAVYAGEQTSISRPVAIKILRNDLHMDPEAVQKFIADSSAKANVQHPAIVSVYEAGESNGVYYYTREFVEGTTLADLSAAGTRLDEVTALKVIRVVSEALSYLNHTKTPHSPVSAGNIFLNEASQPRLANLATVEGELSASVQSEIQALAKIVSGALNEGAGASPETRALLVRMRMEGSAGFLSWGALIQAVRALEPKVVPKDAYKLSAQDEAALRAVESERERQRKALLYNLIGLATLIPLIIGVIIWRFSGTPDGRIFDRMIEVPAGEFIYQDGEKRTLPAFWIDEFEVSIGMYRRFLDFVEENPEEVKKLAHPDMPADKTHRPDGWDLMLEAARRAKVTFRGSHLNLDMPVFNVDWYDAYAYAKFMGRRLPTEEEWEKAGRGREGFVFPWGNEMDAKKVNSSIDFNPNPTIGGEVDGYNRWAPVDAHSGDSSPFGVRNMAGNVVEWTGTFDESPNSPGTELPVIRGGSYESEDVVITRRNVILDPLQRDQRVGFRTASETAPQE